MQISVALSAQQYVSESADKSFLQTEYETAFRGMCSKYGVAQPFELDDDRLRDFFEELKSSWKMRKRDLFKEGKITADQL